MEPKLLTRDQFREGVFARDVPTMTGVGLTMETESLTVEPNLC